MIARAFLIAVLLAVSGRQAREIQVAVVVHKENDIEDLPLEALRKIWMGERTFWKNGKSIKLLAIAETSNAPARQTVLEKLYRMDEKKYHRYWELKKFKGEAASAPPEKTEEQMAPALGSDEDAIGYISVTALGKLPREQREKLKVLKIDGKSPGDEGYLLRKVLE